LPAELCIEEASITEDDLKLRNKKNDYSNKIYLEPKLNPVSPSLIDFGLDIITDTLFAHFIELSWLQRFLEEVAVAALEFLADIVFSIFSGALFSGCFFGSFSA